jgi:hypothetical protein
MGSIVAHVRRRAATFAATAAATPSSNAAALSRTLLTQTVRTAGQ